jgi:hypothetical protein
MKGVESSKIQIEELLRPKAMIGSKKLQECVQQQFKV